MTTDLDDQIRSALRSWADEVPHRVGDPNAILASGPNRPRTTRRWVAVAALTAVAAALLVVAVRSTAGSDGTDTASELSTETAIGDPPAITYNPTESGWRVSDIALVVDPPELDFLEYDFAHDDGRRLQLSLYPQGSREATSGLPGSATVTVRGRPGKDTTYQDGRYRIDWDESSRTWEATGYSFESLQALATALDGFEVTDAATWHQWLPADVAAYLNANPADGFFWNRSDGLKPREVPSCPPPAPLDTPFDPSNPNDPYSGAVRAPEALEQLATELFPGYTVSNSSVLKVSANCRSRQVELSNGSPQSLIRIGVHDGLGLQSAEPLTSTGKYLWENEGVVGISVLTSQGREVAVTALKPDAETDSRVRDPAFADQLRAGVEALGY